MVSFLVKPFEGVETIVVLVDAGGLQMLVEEDGGVAVGAAELVDVAGNLAGLVEAVDEKGEVFRREVVPIAIEGEAAQRACTKAKSGRQSTPWSWDP